MRNDRLFSGLVLVLIGAIFLLNNFGYIDFHWSNLFYLWPVFLVMAGVNLVLANNKAGWATAVKVLVLLGGFALLLFSNAGQRHNSNKFNFHYDVDDNDDDNNDDGDDDKNAKHASYQELYTPAVKLARLNISGGATSYILNDTTADLFKAQTKEFANHYNLTSVKTDSVTTLDFDMNSHGHERNIRWNGGHTSSADLKLNTAPQWEISVKGGAAELNFDLTRFKVKALKLNGGAASYTVKLGANLPVTNVDVSAGVSEIEINVPQNAACDIITSSGLTSTDFDGFDKIDSKHYTTPGFNTAKNKIYIKFKGGVSEFRVNRY